MRIKEIISQHRRDFKAIFECEHCGYTETKSGYDDANYHQNVIPILKYSIPKRRLRLYRSGVMPRYIDADKFISYLGFENTKKERDSD